MHDGGVSGYDFGTRFVLRSGLFSTSFQVGRFCQKDINRVHWQSPEFHRNVTPGTFLPEPLEGMVDARDGCSDNYAAGCQCRWRWALPQASGVTSEI